jgi:hypothetical protein
MSSFNCDHEFDDCESQDEELSIETQSFHTRKAVPAKVGTEVPSELIQSAYPSTKDHSLGKESLMNTMPRPVSYSINQD